MSLEGKETKAPDMQKEVEKVTRDERAPSDSGESKRKVSLFSRIVNAFRKPLLKSSGKSIENKKKGKHVELDESVLDEFLGEKSPSAASSAVAVLDEVLSDDKGTKESKPKLHVVSEGKSKAFPGSESKTAGEETEKNETDVTVEALDTSEEAVFEPDEATVAKEDKKKEDEVVYVDETATFHGVKGNKIAVICPSNFQSLRFSIEKAKALKKKEKVNWIRFQLEKEKQISVTEFSYIEEGDEVIAFGMSDPMGGKRRGKIVMAGVVAYQHYKNNVPKTGIGIYLFATSQTVSFYVVGRGEIITSRRVGIEMAQIALQEIMQYIEHQFPEVDVFYYSNVDIGGDFEVIDVKAVVETLPPTAFISTSTYIPTKGITVVVLLLLIVFASLKDVYEGTKYLATYYNFKKLDTKYAHEKKFFDALRRMVNKQGILPECQTLISDIAVNSPLAVDFLEADHKKCYLLGRMYALTDYGKKLVEEFVYAYGGRTKAENKGKIIEIKCSFISPRGFPGQPNIPGHRDPGNVASLSYFAVSNSLDQTEDLHEQDSSPRGKNKEIEGRFARLHDIFQVVSGRSAYAASEGASKLEPGRFEGGRSEGHKRDLPPPPEFVGEKAGPQSSSGAHGSAGKDYGSEIQGWQPAGGVGKSNGVQGSPHGTEVVGPPPVGFSEPGGPPLPPGSAPGGVPVSPEEVRSKLLPPQYQPKLLEKELSEPFIDPVILQEVEYLKRQIAALQNEKQLLMKKIEEMKKAKNTVVKVNPEGYFLAAILESPESPGKKVYVIKNQDAIIMIRPDSAFSYDNKLFFVKSFDETTRTLVLTDKKEEVKLVFAPASFGSAIKSAKVERVKKTIEKKKEEKEEKSTRKKRRKSSALERIKKRDREDRDRHSRRSRRDREEEKVEESR